MSSTYDYTALSPDYADLTKPQRRNVGVRNPDLPSFTGSAFLKWIKLERTAEVVAEAILRNAGLLLVVASQMFFSLMNVAVKKLNSIDPPVSALELIVVRMSITWICSVAYMLSTGVPHPFRGPEGVRLLLVFRGVSGFFGLIGIYFSLQYLSLSDATVLTFLQPLCIAAAGALVLKEKFSGREAVAGILSLVGVVLIARPPFIFGAGGDESIISSAENNSNTKEATADERLVAVGVALVGVVGATGALTSLRAIGKRAHPLHSLTLFSMYSVIVASIGMVVTKTSFIIPTKLSWLGILIMIGIFGFFAQLLLTMGLARETAGRGSMGIYTQIVFATILEHIFFDVIPSVLSVVGTLIILSCALYVALTKESSKSSGNEDKNIIALKDQDIGSMESGLLQNYDGDDEDEKESVSVIGAQDTRGCEQPPKAKD